MASMTEREFVCDYCKNPLEPGQDFEMGQPVAGAFYAHHKSCKKLWPLKLQADRENARRAAERRLIAAANALYPHLTQEQWRELGEAADALEALLER